MNINDIMKPLVHTNPKISEDVTLPYRMYVPESYDHNKKYSLMIFMHGAGERGEDNMQLHSEDANRYFYYVLGDEKLKEDFILIAPQCHPDHRWVEQNWEQSVYEYCPACQLSVPMTLFYDLLDNVIFENYSIDKNRILMTGISMGGFATWFTMMYQPDLLAAAVPVCGGADPNMAEMIKHIPTWFFHSDDDPVVPSDSFHAMKKAFEGTEASDVHSTLYEHEGHGCWFRAYLEKPTFDWFISRKKKQ